MAEEEVDGIAYIEQLTNSLKKLNMTVETTQLVDEDKIANKVAEKMQRGISRLTTETVGGFR